jgi:DNA-binding transcriptional regulator of glucitol operon
VNRVFLSPKWLFRHVLALVMVATCLRLGWWQFDEARQTGSLQNAGYSLEWPVFALAVVFVWIRLMQWELNPPAKAKRLTRPLHAPARPAAATPAAQAAPVAPAVADDELDDRHARYNRYLAELAAQDEARQR